MIFTNGEKRIRVAVVEDEGEQQALLLSMLSRYGKEHLCRIETVSYHSGDDFLEAGDRFDLILLDIQMPGTDGIATARKLRKTDAEAVLLFITNLAYKAADGYEVDAKGFLVKPVNYLQLERYLDIIILQLEQKQDRYLTISNSRTMHRYRFQEIAFIESMGHYVKIHRTDGSAQMELSPMWKLEEQMQEGPFFRVSNSCIVNLAHIESVEQQELKCIGKTIRISRARKKKLMTALAKYLLGEEPGVH